MAAKEEIEFLRFKESPSIEDKVPVDNVDEVRAILESGQTVYLATETAVYGPVIAATGTGKTRSALQTVFAGQDRSSDIDALLEKVDTNIRIMQRNSAEIAELRTKTRAILAELQAGR